MLGPYGISLFSLPLFSIKVHVQKGQHLILEDILVMQEMASDVPSDIEHWVHDMYSTSM